VALTTSPNDLQWDCDECYGALAIEGVDLAALWVCVDVSDLWGTPEVRGINTRLPGLPGLAPEPYRLDETTHQLPLVVNGHWSTAGVPVAAGATAQQLGAQLEANLGALYASVVFANTTTDVTQTAVWTLPSGATVVAEVQVLRVPPPTLLPGAVARSSLVLRDVYGDLHL
jgi:hypothetical protein